MSETELQLRDGSVTTDRRLDRIVQFDERSRGFPVLRTLDEGQRTPRSYTHPLDRSWDQFQEGHCVEHGVVHDLRARPASASWVMCDEIVRDNRIYWPAQKRDPWEGGSYPGASPQYEGTSVLAGLQVARELGFYSAYYWAFTIEEVALALGYKGPVVFGLWWHRSMFRPDAQGFVEPDGRKAGGHCLAGIGVTLRDGRGRAVRREALAEGGFAAVDYTRSWVTAQQSWGDGHGPFGNGRIRFRLSTLRDLLADDGECGVPTGRRVPLALPAEPR